MPRQKRFTQRRFVDVTPAVDRQIERLSAFHETIVPDLIRAAIKEAYGLTTDQDRQPPLIDDPAAAARTRKRGKAA